MVSDKENKTKHLMNKHPGEVREIKSEWVKTETPLPDVTAAAIATATATGSSASVSSVDISEYERRVRASVSNYMSLGRVRFGNPHPITSPRVATTSFTSASRLPFSWRS